MIFKRSADFVPTNIDQFTLDNLEPGPPAWANYLRGVVRLSYHRSLQYHHQQHILNIIIIIIILNIIIMKVATSRSTTSTRSPPFAVSRQRSWAAFPLEAVCQVRHLLRWWWWCDDGDHYGDAPLGGWLSSSASVLVMLEMMMRVLNTM